MRLFAFVLASAVFFLPAAASEILYTPTNPTFGGNPLNGTYLLGIAQSEKPNPPVPQQTQQSTTQEFLQMLQSQLYASLADSVASAITGQNAQAAGTIKLDNLQISWDTVGGQKQITMTDFSTGQVTQISLPQVTQ